MGKESFFLEFKIILNHLVTLMKILNNDEIILYYNQLLSIPTPPKNNFEIKLKYITENKIINDLNLNVHIKNCLQNEIPEVSFEIEPLLFSFNTDQIITIYKYVLLEQNVIVFGENAYFLSSIIESIKSICFPFKLMCKTFTFLDRKYYGLIELSCNDGFLYGINSSFNYDFFTENNIKTCNFNKKTLIVNIDENEVFSLDKLLLNQKIMVNMKDLNNFSESSLKTLQLPPLPFHYKIKLISRLSNFISEYFDVDDLSNKKDLSLNKNIKFDRSKEHSKTVNIKRRSTLILKNSFSKISDFNIVKKNSQSINSFAKKEMSSFMHSNLNKINNEVFEMYKHIVSIFKEIFFYFNISIIKDYELYLNYESINFDSNSLIDKLGNDNDLKNFYGIFLNTNIFRNFVKDKILLKKVFNIEDFSRFSITDETIKLKLNKSFFSFKFETPFLDSTKFNSKNTKSEFIINLKKNKEKSKVDKKLVTDMSKDDILGLKDFDVNVDINAEDNNLRNFESQLSSFNNDKIEKKQIIGKIDTNDNIEKYFYKKKEKIFNYCREMSKSYNEYIGNENNKENGIYSNNSFNNYSMTIKDLWVFIFSKHISNKISTIHYTIKDILLNTDNIEIRFNENKLKEKDSIKLELKKIYGELCFLLNEINQAGLNEIEISNIFAIVSLLCHSKFKKLFKEMYDIIKLKINEIKLFNKELRMNTYTISILLDVISIDFYHKYNDSLRNNLQFQCYLDEIEDDMITKLNSDNIKQDSIFIKNYSHSYFNDNLLTKFVEWYKCKLNLNIDVTYESTNIIKYKLNDNLLRINEDKIFNLNSEDLNSSFFSNKDEITIFSKIKCDCCETYNNLENVIFILILDDKL